MMKPIANQINANTTGRKSCRKTKNATKITTKMGKTAPPGIR